MTAWLLVIHLVGMVFWMGGLLIVTNLLSAHTQETSADGSRVLGRMEMKLLKGLGLPGAILMVVSGFVLVFTNREYYFHADWLWAKLFLVAMLLGLHAIVHLRTKALVSGEVRLRRSECVAYHSVIAVLFLGILILVLVKPI
jgi:putative membrane protein